MLYNKLIDFNMKRMLIIFLSGLVLMISSSSIGQTEEPKQKLEARVIKSISLSNLLPTDLIFSPDGSLLFCMAYEGSYNTSTGRVMISMDRNSFILDVKNGKNIANLGGISILTFSNENQVLIEDNGIKIWNYKYRKGKGVITKVDGSIYCTSDGKYAATIINGGRVIITDLVLKNQISDFQIPQIDESDVKILFYGPEKLFMVSIEDTLLQLTDIINNQQIASFNWNSEEVDHSAMTSDCKYLAVSSGGPVYLYDIPENNMIQKLELFQGRLNSLSFSKDNSVLGGCTSSNQVVLFDMKSKTEYFISINEHKAPIFNICFSPVEDIFVTSSFDGTIKIWEYYYVEDD